MNAARSLVRCSRLVTCRGFSSMWNNGKIKINSATANALPTHLSMPKILRPMSSTTKFEVINVQDEEDFQKRVLQSSNSVPIIVDFHATWCGPCRILAPKLESLLSKEDGRVLMAKVDIDEHPELAMEYGVQSVPTVIGVKNGQVQDKFVGVKEDDQISSFVDKLVVS